MNLVFNLKQVFTLEEVSEILADQLSLKSPVTQAHMLSYAQEKFLALSLEIKDPIRATESLNKAFASARVLQDINAVYPIFKPLELIEIRDLNKMATHFVPSLEIKLMTDAVARYNDALEQANIDITLDKYQYPVKIDLTRKFVRRIFNNYSIESGGRLAGVWWLSCPSDARSRILIGRLETIEIDLKGLHPVLLYAEAGIDYFDEMGHDPYSVCEVEGVMGRCINSEDKAQD